MKIEITIEHKDNEVALQELKQIVASIEAGTASSYGQGGGGGPLVAVTISK